MLRTTSAVLFCVSCFSFPLLSLASAGEEPGPACQGEAMTPERLAELAWGDSVVFDSPVRSGRGVRVADTHHSRHKRECTQRREGTTCTPWQAVSPGGSGSSSEALFLGASEGTVTVAVYHRSRGTVRLSHSDFRTYTTGGMSISRLSLEALPRFDFEDNYSSWYLVDGAGHANSNYEGPVFSGRVLANCAKFQSRSQSRRTDFGGGLVKYVEEAWVIHSEF